MSKNHNFENPVLNFIGVDDNPISDAEYASLRLSLNTINPYYSLNEEEDDKSIILKLHNLISYFEDNNIDVVIVENDRKPISLTKYRSIVKKDIINQRSISFDTLHDYTFHFKFSENNQKMISDIAKEIHLKSTLKEDDFEGVSFEVKYHSTQWGICINCILLDFACFHKKEDFEIYHKFNNFNSYINNVFGEKLGEDFPEIKAHASHDYYTKGISKFKVTFSHKKTREPIFFNLEDSEKLISFINDYYVGKKRKNDLRLNTRKTTNGIVIDSFVFNVGHKKFLKED